MAATSIEWTDATWNPLRARERTTGKVGHHCEKISPGCANCYASTFQRRFGLPLYTGPSRLEAVKPFLDAQVLRQPLSWEKPRRVFTGSMTDIFGDWHTNEDLNRCFAVMALASQHTFQVLTKRPERMRDYMTDPHRGWHVSQWMAGSGMIPGTWCGERPPWPPPNVWLGVSVEDQQRAEERIPLLLQTPATVRFLSCEPLLSPLTLFDTSEGVLRGPAVIVEGGVTPSTPDAHSEGYDSSYAGVDWVIVGAESGPGARPCDIAWVRSLVEQCRAAGVSCFVKQLGSNVRYAPRNGPAGLWPEHVRFDYEARGEESSHRIRLRSPKGGNPDEWPQELRVRQFPETEAANGGTL